MFANKSDMPGALSASSIAEKLGLSQLKASRRWFASRSHLLTHLTHPAFIPRYIQTSSAVTGEGLYEGLDWLCSDLQKHPVAA